MDTFTRHADLEAAFKTAVLTAVACVGRNLTFLSIRTPEVYTLRDTASKEPLQTLGKSQKLLTNCVGINPGVS